MTTPADIPNCDYCGQVQGTPGGLVFSPPDDGGFVRKYHACTECFIARFIPDAAGFDIVARQPDRWALQVCAALMFLAVSVRPDAAVEHTQEGTE